MKGFYAYSPMSDGVDTDAAWDYIRHGHLLLPRTVLKGRVKLPQLELPALIVEPNQLPALVQQSLETAMGDLRGHRRAVMFSGGFDSMLIALLAKQCGAEVTGVTVQFDDFNLLTVSGSIQFANKIGIDHHIIHVKAVEFLSAFEALASLTDEPILDLDLAIVYAAFKKYDLTIAGDTFISGMGSDQWYGNEALELKRGSLAVRLDWAHINEEAHHRVARVFGYQFIFPFSTGPMLAISQSVPVELKQDKKLLRALAVANKIPHRGLRSEIYQVPALMRQVLIKTYGRRAWPAPVVVEDLEKSSEDQLLRQIVLGLWLEAFDKITA